MGRSTFLYRIANTLSECGYSVCLIDGDVSDQQEMVSYAIQQLPAEFQSADCWYHFSSSMGIKAGIRVHLWFWLDRSCSDDEMKAWLSGCPVDLRLFNPTQIHLTANPRFIERMKREVPLGRLVKANEDAEFAAYLCSQNADCFVGLWKWVTRTINNRCPKFWKT